MQKKIVSNKNYRIKILHIMSPGSGNFGGIESFLYQYYKYIDQNAIEFDFVFCRNNTMVSRMQDVVLKNCNMYELSILESGNNSLSNWIELYKNIREIINRNCYDIIEVHTGSPIIQTICSLAISKYNAVKIAHSHSVSMENKKSALLQIIIKSCSLIINYRYDYLFACSIVAGEVLYGKRAVNRNKFYKINNAIEAEEFRYSLVVRERIREKYFLDSDITVIGHVARLSEEKNQLFLIDIFQEYIKINNNSILWIVGEGPMRSKIESKIKQLKLEKKIILFGEKHNIPELLQAMDVFVVPSFSEGLCISAIESQAAGLPTIVSSGVPDECNITKLFRKISLNEPATIWAEMINSIDDNREDTYPLVKEAGYDIKEAAYKLQNLYLKSVFDKIG